MVMETFLLHEFRAWSFQSPSKFRVSLFLSPFQSFVSFQIQIDVKRMTCFLVYWVLKSSLLVISLISMGSPNFILLLLPKIFLVYQIDLRAFFFLQRMNPKKKKEKKKKEMKKGEFILWVDFRLSMSICTRNSSNSYDVSFYTFFFFFFGYSGMVIFWESRVFWIHFII